MTELPTEGGSYIRDPETGALTRIPDDPPPAPEGEAADQPTPDSKRKGGK